MAKTSAVLSASLQLDNASKNALEQLSRQISTTRREAVAQFDLIESSVNDLGIALRNSAAYAAGAFIISVGTSQLVGALDLIKNVNSQFKLLTSTGSEFAYAWERTGAIALDTRQEFKTTQELVSRMARSTKDMNFSLERSAKLAEIISQLTIIGGSSPVEGRQGLIQFSQGLGSGVLRGDEFRSVSEQLQGVADALAEALDVSRGELTQLAYAGKLTSDVVIAALESVADETAANFENVDKTIGGTFSQLVTTILLKLKELDESGISPSGVLIGGLDLLIENLETIVNLSAAGAGLALARSIGLNVDSTLANASKQIKEFRNRNVLRQTGMESSAEKRQLQIDQFLQRDSRRDSVDPTQVSRALKEQKAAITKALSLVLFQEGKDVSQIVDGFYKSILLEKETIGKLNEEISRLEAQKRKFVGGKPNVQKKFAESVVLDNGNVLPANTANKYTINSLHKDAIERLKAQKEAVLNGLTDIDKAVVSLRPLGIMPKNEKEQLAFLANLAGQTDNVAVKNRLAALASNVHLTAMEKLKNATDGLVDALGGKWGVALIAAGVGLAAFGDEIAELARNLDPMKKALEDTGRAFDLFRGQETFEDQAAGAAKFYEELLKIEKAWTNVQELASLASAGASIGSGVSRASLGRDSGSALLDARIGSEKGFKEFEKRTQISAGDLRKSINETLTILDQLKKTIAVAQGDQRSALEAESALLNDVLNSQKRAAELFNKGLEGRVARAKAAREKIEKEYANSQAGSAQKSALGFDLSRAVNDEKIAIAGAQRFGKVFENLQKYIKTGQIDVEVNILTSAATIDLKALQGLLANLESDFKRNQFELELETQGLSDAEKVAKRTLFNIEQDFVKISNGLDFDAAREKIDEFNKTAEDLARLLGLSLEGESYSTTLLAIKKAADETKASLNGLNLGVLAEKLSKNPTTVDNFLKGYGLFDQNGLITKSLKAADNVAKSSGQINRGKPGKTFGDVIDDVRREIRDVQLEIDNASDDIALRVAKFSANLRDQLKSNGIKLSGKQEKVVLGIVAEFQAKVERKAAVDKIAEEQKKFEDELRQQEDNFARTILEADVEFRVRGDGKGSIEKRRNELSALITVERLAGKISEEQKNALIAQGIAADQAANAVGRLEESYNAAKKKAEDLKNNAENLTKALRGLAQNVAQEFISRAANILPSMKETAEYASLLRSEIERIEAIDSGGVLSPETVENLAKEWANLNFAIGNVEKSLDLAGAILERNISPADEFARKIAEIERASTGLALLVNDGQVLAEIIENEINTAFDEMNEKIAAANPFKKYHEDAKDALRNAEDLGEAFESIAREFAIDSLEALIFGTGNLSEKFGSIFGKKENGLDTIAEDIAREGQKQAIFAQEIARKSQEIATSQIATNALAQVASAAIAAATALAQLGKAGNSSGNSLVGNLLSGVFSGTSVGASHVTVNVAGNASASTANKIAELVSKQQEIAKSEIAKSNAARFHRVGE